MAKLLINGGIFARISICPKIAAGFLIKEFTSSKQSIGGVVLSGALAEQDIFCYCTSSCSASVSSPPYFACSTCSKYAVAFSFAALTTSRDCRA